MQKHTSTKDHYRKYTIPSLDNKVGVQKRDSIGLKGKPEKRVSANLC